MISSRPEPLPLPSDEIVIAAFWTDHFITTDVSYRASDDATFLNQVESYINDEDNFSPASLFICTWKLFRFVDFECLVRDTLLTRCNA